MLEWNEGRRGHVIIAICLRNVFWRHSLNVRAVALFSWWQLKWLKQRTVDQRAAWLLLRGGLVSSEIVHANKKSWRSQTGRSVSLITATGCQLIDHWSEDGPWWHKLACWCSNANLCLTSALNTFSSIASWQASSLLTSTLLLRDWDS